MPELPDVEVYKQYLDATSLHHRIRDIDVDAAGRRMLRGVSTHDLHAALVGHELAQTRRHGKHLFARITGGGWLRLHFGMTGDLRYFKHDGAKPAHTRLRFDFINGYHLAFIDVRMFGAIGLVDDVDAFIAAERLGPDARYLDAAGFRNAVAGHRGPIKSTLMDQQVLAGLGNVYTDEVLFAAHVDPRARTDDLDDATLRKLHRATRTVLEQAIDARVELDRFPRSFLLRHRGGDETCPRCGRRLQHLRIGGRTTYYCPREQTRRRKQKRPLARPFHDSTRRARRTTTRSTAPSPRRSERAGHASVPGRPG
jgi:formamidopyrimidine-DNA glycosylase